MSIRNKFKYLGFVSKIFEDEGTDSISHHFGLPLKKDAVFCKEIKVVAGFVSFELPPDLFVAARRNYY